MKSSPKENAQENTITRENKDAQGSKSGPEYEPYVSPRSAPLTLTLHDVEVNFLLSLLDEQFVSAKEIYNSPKSSELVRQDAFTARKLVYALYKKIGDQIGLNNEHDEDLQ